jgi:hypothetical protein
MANRILIVANSDAGQALPVAAMEKFQQVIIFIGNGQTSLPIDMVSQLLALQATQSTTIELQQVKQSNKPAFDMQLAMYIGRLSERSADSQITCSPPMPATIPWYKAARRAVFVSTVSMASKPPRPLLPQKLHRLRLLLPSRPPLW